MSTIQVVEKEEYEGNKIAWFLKNRGKLAAMMALSVIVTLAVLCYLGFVLYAIFTAIPEATFKAPNKVIIKPQPPEHKMNIAKHEAMAPKPTFDKRLVSTKPTAFALPEFEDVEVDQVMPTDPTTLFSPNATNLTGRGGLGSGSGTGIGGSGGTGDGIGFFGIEDKARSVVIMIDVSGSMFGRTGDLDYDTGKLVRKGKDQAFQVIRDNAINLVNSLSINSRFGIIRWSGGAYSWKPTLVNATAQNKADAIAHIQNRVDSKSAGPRGGRPGGTRHDYALEELFKLNPEVAYMLSDGNATRSGQRNEDGSRGGMTTIDAGEIIDIVRDAKKTMPKIPRIHTIYYLTGADKSDEERMLRGISRTSGGKSIKVKAEKRKN